MRIACRRRRCWRCGRGSERFKWRRCRAVWGGVRRSDGQCIGRCRRTLKCLQRLSQSELSAPAIVLARDLVRLRRRTERSELLIGSSGGDVVVGCDVGCTAGAVGAVVSPVVDGSSGSSGIGGTSGRLLFVVASAMALLEVAVSAGVQRADCCRRGARAAWRSRPSWPEARQARRCLGQALRHLEWRPAAELRRQSGCSHGVRTRAGCVGPSLIFQYRYAPTTTSTVIVNNGRIELIDRPP